MAKKVKLPTKFVDRPAPAIHPLKEMAKQKAKSSGSSK